MNNVRRTLGGAFFACAMAVMALIAGSLLIGLTSAAADTPVDTPTSGELCGETDDGLSVFADLDGECPELCGETDDGLSVFALKDGGCPDSCPGLSVFGLPTGGPGDGVVCDGHGEDHRVLAVASFVWALESYADTNGTFHVEDSGFQGRGTGYGFYESAQYQYPTSIASVLVAEGHFSADALHDPLWQGADAIEGDVMVYRCKDRAAVFTRYSEVPPTQGDSDWWADNACNRYPIDTLGAQYFRVTLPLAHLPSALADDTLRVSAVDAMVDALESYADEYGHYYVHGGAHGNGAGWAFYEEAGTIWSTSITRVLIEGGHLPNDPLHDPLWVNELSIKGDMLVYPCKDRVAVFTREGVRGPASSDEAWWNDNGCRRYPIDNLNATYYQLSRPLPG